MPKLIPSSSEVSEEDLAEAMAEVTDAKGAVMVDEEATEVMAVMAVDSVEVSGSDVKRKSEKN
jgi:hypothetical protein